VWVRGRVLEPNSTWYVWLFVGLVFFMLLRAFLLLIKQCRYRPGVAQRVPGS